MRRFSRQTAPPRPTRIMPPAGSEDASTDSLIVFGAELTGRFASGAWPGCSPPEDGRAAGPQAATISALTSSRNAPVVDRVIRSPIGEDPESPKFKTVNLTWVVAPAGGERVCASLQRLYRAAGGSRSHGRACAHGRARERRCAS